MYNCAKCPLRPCAQSKLDVRWCVCVSVGKRDFSQQFLGGGHMLESKHDLKLENSRIFKVPKKDVPSFALAVNHGWFEDPVLGSLLNTFGVFFQKSYY